MLKNKTKQTNENKQKTTQKPHVNEIATFRVLERKQSLGRQTALLGNMQVNLVALVTFSFFQNEYSFLLLLFKFSIVHGCSFLLC